jgi:hypothetical protein
VDAKDFRAARPRGRRHEAFMDELLREFLTETAESLDHVDAQLVRFRV